MFKFRSGNNSLNKEFGRYRGVNDDGHLSRTIHNSAYNYKL